MLTFRERRFPRNWMALQRRGDGATQAADNQSGSGLWNAAKQFLGMVVSKQDSAFYSQQGYRWGVQAYDNIIRRNPDNSMAHNNRGWAYFELGEHHTAMEDFNEAIRLDPHNAWAYANRAATYISLGMDADALLDVEHVVSLGLDPLDLNEKIEPLPAWRPGGHP